MLWHGAAGMLSERVGVYAHARPYALRVRKSCPECGVDMLCLCRNV